MSELVSTIIPAYNRANYLAEAVQSVLAQTYRPIEIILVDDGSTDGTGDLAEQLARENEPVVKVIHRENGGPGAARETGRLAVQGDYIQYLDSDDLLLPRKFEQQVAALKQNPDCGIAYGITRLIDANGNTLQEPYKWTGRRFEYLFPALLVDRWWNTHTPLWRREVCDRIGPWPTGSMGEDWIYDSQAAGLQVKLTYVPEVASATRRHSNDRLTGGAPSPEKCRDITDIIIALHKAALKAQVDPGCPEMWYFSRWAFLEARRAGAFGLNNEAKVCFAIAQKRSPGFDLKMRLTGGMARLTGWSITGRFCGLLESLSHRTPGKETLAKSIR